MKKRFAVLLTLLIALTLLPLSPRTASAETSGWCGSDLLWYYEADTFTLEDEAYGTLTFEGYGEMPDYGVYYINGELVNTQPWADFADEIGEVILPDGLTGIGAFAFYGCDGLRGIDIPSSVNRIGQYAFSSCHNLESVSIPYGVTTVDQYTFSCCQGLKSVSIPNSVKSIKRNAFDHCSSLSSVSIPGSVTEIGEDAFSNCTGLTSVVIPDSVESIEEYAFDACSSLKSVTLPKKLAEIPKGVFYGCENLTAITIPKTTKSIGDHAFDSCSGLKEIVLPEGLTSIGEYAFRWCTGLTSIVIPNSVTSIGSGAFGVCENLASVRISNRIKSIENWTFSYCESLTSVTIPGGVTSIGEDAFKECFALTTVTIPNTVKTIGNEAFLSCNQLAEVYFCGTEAQKDAVSIGSDNSALINAEWHCLTKPEITGQPKAATVKAGETATFEVIAKGANGYQWQYSKDNGATWTNWSGKTGETVTVAGSATNNGCFYRCLVKGASENKYSGWARLTVSNVKPMILTQPKDASVASGKDTTFKVVAGGTSKSYQWQYSKNNGASWTNWSGKTSATLTVTGSATNNGCLYRCVVKNSKGSVTSSNARLTVSNVKPMILVQPKAQMVVAGKTVTFKVVAGGSGLSYQWQWSKDGKTWTNCKSGNYNKATFSFIAAGGLSGRQYRCVVKNSYGSVNSTGAVFKIL